MGVRTVSFAPEEWFHCYTRGVDKRDIFMDDRDRKRFLMLLYACNSTTPIHVSNITVAHQGLALREVLRRERGEQYVEVASYCLMDNHVHLVLRELIDGGISAFMQKLGTGYTMYFNKKYERTGALFSSRFKAKHVADDLYLRRLINYVHANPAELFEPEWKKGIVRDERRLRHALLSYPFSSLPDYEGSTRPEAAILEKTSLLDTLEREPSVDTLLEDARDFYVQEAPFE